MKEIITILSVIVCLNFNTTSQAQEANFIGEVQIFTGNFAPRNFAFCNGQLLSISENTALFSILGTTYGGDGRVIFGLPDLRSRVAIHEGHGPGLEPYSLGERAGVETTYLSQASMPNHGHAAQVNAAATVDNGQESNDPTNAVWAEEASYSRNNNVNLSSAAVQMGNAGNSQGTLI